MQAPETKSSRTTGPERSAEPQVAEWIVRLFGNRAPLGFQAGDENLYRYVDNSPTTATDPSGLQGAPLGGLTDEEREARRVRAWYAARESGSVRNTYTGFGGEVFSYSVAYDYFTLEERRTLLFAIGRVRSALEQVLRDIPPISGRTLDSHPNETTAYYSLPFHIRARLLRWFGEPISNLTLNRIRMVFVHVQNAIDHRTLNFENDPADDGGTQAWVFAVGNIASDIHLLPVFYRRPPRRQAGIIFHELTHRYASTSDYGYFPDSCLDRTPGAGPAVDLPRPNAPTYGEGVTLPQRDLVRNADTYEGFLEDYYLEAVPDRR